MSDPPSCLKPLQIRIPINQKVRPQRHTLADLQETGKPVELCWVPGHAGTPENESPDKKAK